MSQLSRSDMALEFESERLGFRPLLASDIDLIIEQWTDPEVTRYVADRTYSEAELKEEMPLVTRRVHGGRIGIWALTEKVSSDKIGTAILLPMPVEKDDTDWDIVTGEELPDAEIEVGYVLKRSAWRRGFATEACGRMIQFAFEETALPYLVACIDPRNDASRHVLLKCGLNEVGTIRAYAADLPGFRITREAWRRP